MTHEAKRPADEPGVAVSAKRPMQGKANRTVDMTPEEVAALNIARDFIKAGVPVFAAAPNPDKPGEYYLPPKWELTVPSEVWLEKWRPGWALAAVGGHAADFLDNDPRNGGTESIKELELQGQMPRAFGVQETPSGGKHYVISLTGERKSTGFMPGLDLQSGSPEPDVQGKHGRGFVYIAPTIRPSKAPETLGQLRAYRWEKAPDFDYLSEFVGSDDTVEGIVARVHAKRSHAGVRAPAPEAGGGVSQLFTNGAAWGMGREFTRAEAEAYCAPALDALERARVGEIEEHANTAAAVLSHFVPALWDADFAYAVLLTCLAKTAYDPAHPASTWTAEKFRAVLDGRRPPADNWKATAKVTAADVAAIFGDTGNGPMPLPATAEQAEDAVEAMLSRMLTAEQMCLKPPPEPLIWDLLDRDTIAALIGQPGSFKSFVALDMAGHVGTGKPWRGRRVHQGEVVYIAAEGERGMTLRVRAWQKVNGQMTGVRFLPEPVQIADPVAWRVLIEACRRIQPVMVVIDTQAMMSIGMEENSNTEMSVVMDAFKTIKRATGACVLVVHHTTKAGDTTRGASAQDGAQDTRLKLERQTPRSSMVVKMIEGKQKDMAEGDDGGEVMLLETVELGTDPITGRRLSSLVLGDMSAFRAAQGATVIAPEDAWEPPVESVRELVLRVLRDHGEERGVTSADARKIVLERWYQADASRLLAATWRSAWNRAIKEEYVINVGGERYTVDPLGQGDLS